MRRTLLTRLLDAKAAKRPVVLVTRLDDGAQALLDAEVIEGDLALTDAQAETARTMLKSDHSGTIEDGALFVQSFNPPLRLIVVGAVHIAQALVPMAQLTGYDVTVVDPRQAWATDARFPGVTLDRRWPDEALQDLAPDNRTAVVTLTHDPKLDDPALLVACKAPAFYIAALGSTRTHAKRLARLGEEGLSEREMTRIHGPAGLAIGARSPAEIALSVLAEMTGALHGAPRLKRDAAA
jgi:xanthine dehydrogenase accessory factor